MLRTLSGHKHAQYLAASAGKQHPHADPRHGRHELEVRQQQLRDATFLIQHGVTARSSTICMICRFTGSQQAAHLTSSPRAGLASSACTII